MLTGFIVMFEKRRGKEDNFFLKLDSMFFINQ